MAAPRLVNLTHRLQGKIAIFQLKVWVWIEISVLATAIKAQGGVPWLADATV